MKYTLLLCMICLLLAANTCLKKDKVAAELVGQTWLHAYEEDEKDVMVYRPNSYNFPPARGRTGFTIEQGGVIRQYEIAPADGLEEHTGTWEQLDRNTVQVHIPGNGNPSRQYNIEIISLKGRVLKIRKQPLAEEETGNRH